MHRGVPIRIGFICGVAAFGLVPVAVAEEGVAFKNLMGTIGIMPQDKDPIRYRERAPLVIPPKASLPAPSASYASTNPQWPNDPDVAAKRRASELQRNPVTWSETRRMSDNNARLSPAELGAGRSATTPGSVPGSHRGDNARDVLLLSPDQMRAGTKASDDKPVDVGAEPPRKILSEPPTGLRRSASGKKVEPGFEPRVDQQALDANPVNWLTRRFTSGNDDE